MPNLITVCAFGPAEPARLDSIQTTDSFAYEATGFDVHTFADDKDVQAALARHRPHVIVSFGATDSFPGLLALPLEWRKRWIPCENPKEDGATIAHRIMGTWIVNAGDRRFPEAPLVSVFTPAYNTGAGIRCPFSSLQQQSYNNWEWIVYDDSSDGGATFQHLMTIAAEDCRVSAFSGHIHCGSIGEVKRRACGLCRGEILVELDHDDELTNHALGDIVEAFAKFPDAGFAYTDCAEVYANGLDRIYGKDWAFGFGGYRDEQYDARTYKVGNEPDVNAKTIRHIVGAPNHARAWRRSTYHELTGHSPECHVADDYELIVRTFLCTRMIHVRRFGYIQHFGGSDGNTQFERNGEIQRLVRWIAWKYDRQIHDRFVQLGVDDFIWKDDHCDWAVPNPTPTPCANYALP
jgi:glycosyltransferase involved in cell wall biosynthesis